MSKDTVHIPVSYETSEERHTGLCGFVIRGYRTNNYYLSDYPGEMERVLNDPEFILCDACVLLNLEKQ